MASITRRNYDFTCFICKQTVIGPYSKLTQHFRAAHLLKTSNMNKGDLICGQNGCKMPCKDFNALRYHLNNCELCILNSESKSNETQSRSLPVVEINTPLYYPSDRFENNNTALGCDVVSSVASMIVGLKAKHNVSHAALDYLASEMQLLFHNLSLAPPINFTHPAEALHALNSQVKRTNYFERELGFVAPVEKAVGDFRLLYLKKRSGETVNKQVSSTFQYIPLQKTLSALFANDNFFQLYFSEKASSDGYIRSHRDSLHFRRHPLFSKNPFALRLLIFFDEVEAVNPLGSKVKIHELGNFCFIILNLPTAENSLLSNIHPYSLVKSKNLKLSGFSFVLDEFLHELADLESDEGMLLTIPGRPNFRVQGTIAISAADTKGAHELGGFMSPSCDKFCRGCLISRRDIRQHPTSKSLVLRNQTNYDNGVKQAKNVENGDSSTGLKRDCPLNKSRYFKIYDNLIFDAMHDLLEGVCPFVTKLVIRHWILFKSEYGISAQLLNRRLLLFSTLNRI